MDRSHETFAARALEILANAPGLSPREGQRRMLALAAGTLAGGRPAPRAAVEAPTGVGKSCAYLIPAALLAAETGRRVLVATATKNLQEQLAGKDLPFVRELVRRAAGRDVSFAVMYGKGSYLCPDLLERRLAALWAGAEDRLARGAVPGPRMQEELCWLDMLAAWLADGGAGLQDRVPAWPYLPGSAGDRERWWARASAADEDADCEECGLRPGCRFRADRDAAAAAQVVVANHHLALADALLRRKAGISLFAGKRAAGGPPAVLILDEAHDFLDAAKSALEVSFSRGRVERLRSDVFDFLRDLRAWCEEEGFGREAAAAAGTLGAARRHERKRWPAVERGLDALSGWADELLGGEEEEEKEKAVLPAAPPPAGSLLEDLERLFSPAGGLAGFALRAAEAAGAAVESAAEREDDRALARRFARFRRRAWRLAERWEELEEAFRRAVLLERHYMLAGREGDVCVAERPGKFKARPADPAPFLRELWRQYDRALFTSATLFPRPDGFGWFRERFGLAEGEISLASVPGPFDYERQMEAYVLTNPELNPPDNDGDGEDGGGRRRRRAEALARAVLRTAERAAGGVLALFTSKKEMREVAALVRSGLPTDRILLVQGEAGKAELLERFKSHGRAVLFGAASFWQGVDVPGDALSAVVIARLPFPRPDDPDVMAEAFLAGPGGGWAKVWLPRMSLALRQGVGRLIRTETDRGMVVICDPRAAGRFRRAVEESLPVPPKKARLAP